MSFDRQAGLRAAEKLLRLGKLQPAIAAYTRLVQDDPRDWDTGIFLATLYLRARDVDSAVTHLTAVADALCLEGDVSRAADVYKRILEARPGDEHALRQAAGLAVSCGDAASARVYLVQLADQQIGRGDSAGAADTLSELCELDPADTALRERVFELSLDAGNLDRARRHASTGAHMRRLADALQEAGRGEDALALLRDAIQQDPDHLPTVAHLARLLVVQGDAAAAAEHLTPAMAGADPEARIALIEIFLRGGKGDAALDVAQRTIADNPETIDPLARLACVAAPHLPETAFKLVELAVARWTADAAWEPAAAALQQFVASAPTCIDALVRLVEVAVDGGLNSTASHAQEMLADAYLAMGAIEDGLAIAEDLAAREPENPVHQARVRQAQELQGGGAPHTTSVNRGPSTVLPFRAAAAS